MQNRFGLVFLCAMVAIVLLVAACTPTATQDGGEPQITAAAMTAPSPSAAPTEATMTAAPTDLPTATMPAEATIPVEATATVPSASLDEFVSGLMSAIDSRDFVALERYMADPFTIGYWLSEGVSSSPAEAVELFESSFLPEGAQIVWADPDTDLSWMLQGQPPGSFLGPDEELAAALLSYGWDTNAGGEAIQFITRQPDGTYSWELMLYSSFGFAGFPSEVTAVVINADEATFYDGPGTTFNPVATVFGGLTYPVIGASTDNQWWRLRCYDDNNALIPQCWVSADPSVSSPTTLTPTTAATTTPTPDPGY